MSETTTQRPTWELVYEDLLARQRRRDSFCPVLAQVMEDAGMRDLVGRESYGVPLTADTCDDNLRECYAELLDAPVYLRADMERAPADPNDLRRRQIYDELLALLPRVRRLIDERGGEA
jgi:hypothetical protein